MKSRSASGRQRVHYRIAAHQSFISNERGQRVLRFHLSLDSITSRRDDRSILLNFRGQPALAKHTDNDEILETIGRCISNSVGIVCRAKRAGPGKHHHGLRTAIQVVRAGEWQVLISRNGLGGVRCGSAHVAVGDVDRAAYIQQRRRLLCRRSLAVGPRVRVRQVLLD